MSVIIDVVKVAEDADSVAYTYAKFGETPETRPGLILVDKNTSEFSCVVQSSSASDTANGSDAGAAAHKIKKTFQETGTYPDKVTYAA